MGICGENREFFDDDQVKMVLKNKEGRFEKMNQAKK